MTTSEKYWWIMNHPKFFNKDMVAPQIDIEPHDVCPSTNRIEDFSALNTKTQLWVEFLVPMLDESTGKWVQAHDFELDCGGDTYAEAINNIYNNVLRVYGNYTDDESDEIFNTVHGQQLSSTSSMFSSIMKAHESRSAWNTCILDEFTKISLQEDIKNIENTINALQTFMKTCTLEQLKEAKKHLDTEECKLWLIQKSLEKGIDLDI